MIFQVSASNLINLIMIAVGIGVCVMCFLQVTSSVYLRGIVRRYFQLLFLLIFLNISAHLARQLMEGLPGSGVCSALYAVTFFEGLTAGVMSYIMSLLVLTVTEPGKSGKRLAVTLHLLLLAHALVVIVGSFHGRLFYFDANNGYHRGAWYLLSNVCPAVMLLINVALLIRCGRNVDRRVKSAFWIYILAPLAAIAIQSVTYNIQYIIFATVAATVYMYFVIVLSQREQSEKQSKAITRLQNGLILVLADMVESRDKCTGDHVRKTAEYVRIIMEQMKKDGTYADRMTDDFIEDVVRSAPLHDVGKIEVPDAILNKPGKLSDAEFEEIKGHTTEGKDIISRAIDMVSEEDSGYLNEARNLAYCHHEKWNGTGYPQGLSGEQIPLSARIMAVADVFDALVSRRSYKDPFPFDKAVQIIREGSGTHFDPVVVNAFLEAEDEVHRVACSEGKA